MPARIANPSRLAPPTGAAVEGSVAARELVSVVVISFNRSAPLLQALRSIEGIVTGGRFHAEIVVVDNASTDDTEAVVDRFASSCPLPVRRVMEPRAGVPFARNRGVREAHGDWVCFFDDDQTAEPEWVLELYKAAKSIGAGCAAGSRDLVINDGSPPPESAMARRLLGEVPALASGGEYHSRWLPNTGNVLIHRRVFEDIGLFNEATLEGGEDTDFFHRYLLAGGKAVFAPKALVHHHIPANRVTEEYLQWVATRHGVVMGRRDLGRGHAYFLASLAGRVLQAGLVFLPRWAWLRVRGKRTEAFDPLCRMRRCQGFAMFARHTLTPSAWRRELALGSFHHRKNHDVAELARSPADRASAFGEAAT